jgi:hypothetical protein
MARWRTSAAAVAVVLVATACGNAEPSGEANATATLPSNAKLAPVGQKPLKAEGTGFLPDEHVKVATKGKTVVTVADAQGGFVVSLPGVNNCESATVTATGDEGSHAEFNLSQVACNDS